MFPELPSQASFPELEVQILEFWKEHQTYQQSLAQRAQAPAFVFYEGPPTANGLPHPGHCLTRAIKDLFPRYRTMRGYRCVRKAGWDTHGLPVEVEVCKELGIHAKEEIESFGVEPFIHRCHKSVWRYVQQWERLTERIGFWIDLKEAYVTYHQSYVESVWWCLQRLFDRGLLYQGHKIVWWWAQGGTALSAGEVGQGYRQVADPSIYVRFPVLDPEGRPGSTSLLVWTTTPWTLPSNQYVAVHPQLRYATVIDSQTGQRLVLAEALVESVAAKLKRSLAVQSTCWGHQLVGLRYLPPFDDYYGSQGSAKGALKSSGQQVLGWRVVAAEFVTVDTGTGVVHQAPAFGEVDYELLLAEQQRFIEGQQPPLLCAVAPDGRFTAEAARYAGMWVKDADKLIVRDLRERGLLYHQEQYVHEYPFCWRAEEDPLIQYPRKSWFIRTTQFKDEMLANNRLIQWLPEHIREGRFGNFLESNVDWALSRERFWGTPLPIWVCDKSGRMEAVASYAELLAKPNVQGTHVWREAKRRFPDLADDLKIHKPYIDAITYQSPFARDGTMRRVPDVIDCWFDSGAMPFAQWGYPHRNAPQFVDQFPADFISEALDQTRGWFYSLLAISTMLFGKDGQRRDDAPTYPFPHPFRNCVVLGLMLGEDGGKMSKSKRNYREPEEIFARYGADALRWYLFASQPPWTTIRYNEQAIKDSIPEFLLRLWNVFTFFVIYANLDKFRPGDSLRGPVQQLDHDVLSRGQGSRPVADRCELDRWILSELSTTTQTVIHQMDRYDSFAACQTLQAFVDALSNWYVRRSRSRFWSSDRQSPDKLDAYWTLYECLLTTCRLIAPFVPFLAEYIWQNLTSVFGDRARDSVHLCDYPAADPRMVDQQLAQRMQLVRQIVSLGRSARMSAKLKVRQPLAKVEVMLASDEHRPWLESHRDLIQGELNVKQVHFTRDAKQYIEYQILPNFKALGPRLGPLMPQVKKQLETADASRLLDQLDRQGFIQLEWNDHSVRLGHEDVQIRLLAKEGWAAARGSECVVVLSTELTDKLVREGLARDLVRFIQQRRKELGCYYADRIEVAVVTQSQEIRQAIEENQAYICEETLTTGLTDRPLAGVELVRYRLGDVELELYVRVTPA